MSIRYIVIGVVKGVHYELNSNEGWEKEEKTAIELMLGFTKQINEQKKPMLWVVELYGAKDIIRTDTIEKMYVKAKHDNSIEGNVITKEM